jgi:hypothetical protein
VRLHSPSRTWWEWENHQLATSSMTTLPVEILTAILEEVDDVQDLWHVRAASRTLCAAATPIAFRILSAITTRGSARNLGRLFDVPDLAAHVKEVAFHNTCTDRNGRTLKYGASLPPHPINDIVICLCGPVAGHASQN